MAGQKSKRRSRKRRSPSAAPRAVPSARREQRAEQLAQRKAVHKNQRRRERRQLGTEGERPPSPFGGLPVSETAIFVGAIGAVVGFIQGGGVALVVGLIVCTLGVVEVTAREHFSGFRSHASLLAAIPAVAAGIAVVLVFGQPRQRSIVLLAVVPVYGIVFWLLRKRFLTARQARIARPPVPRS
ncbi:MAG: hypothetical protein ACR2JH_02085 [Solirubrobacteraceae bacterium]